MRVKAIAPVVGSGTLRIRTQTMLLSLVPVVFLLILLTLALLIQAATLANADFSAQSSRVLAQSARVSSALDNANRGLSNYASSGDLRDFKQYAAAAHDMPIELARFQTLASDQAQKIRANRVVDSITRGMNVLAEYAALLRSGQTEKAKALAMRPSTQALGSEIGRDLAVFDGAQRALIIERTNDARRTVWAYEIALISCSILGILSSLYMTVRFGFSIVRRLQRLAQSAEALGMGESPEPIEGHDEIAELDRVYHTMTRRIQREHAVASVLQRTLLPHELPNVPGLRIDTVYVPAAEQSEVGGDWYDVFELSRGRIGISIGDVAGHGLQAGSIMGTTRQALRMAAYIDAHPSHVLENVNRLVCVGSERTLVTAFFAMFDTMTGELTYAVAGHPLPLVARPSGEVTMLAGEGLVLGVDLHARYEPFTTRLEAGSGMLLYTDGIVEFRRDYLADTERLVDAFRTEYGRVSDNVAQAVQDRLLVGNSPSDDAAIMFIGVGSLGTQPAVQRYQWRFDARDEHSGRRVKRALMWQLGKGDCDASKLSEIEIIAGELISNVARHTPGYAEMALEVQNGSATLQVCDRGEPFVMTRSAPDVFSENGRGLILIRALARDVSIERTANGNCVRAVLL